MAPSKRPRRGWAWCASCPTRSPRNWPRASSRWCWPGTRRRRCRSTCCTAKANTARRKCGPSSICWPTPCAPTAICIRDERTAPGQRSMKLTPDLLERWLRGWSGARGLPAPVWRGGGLMVEVGWPDQVRRHVFLDAGPALQACAGAVREAHVHVKAAVEPAVLLRALPSAWTLDARRSLMAAPRPLAPQPLPAGYHATGRLHLQQGCAVFDRIETDPAHRRRGLARAVMGLLDRGAVEAGAQERLLVASEQGRALYLALGWQVLAPYATAISPQIPATVY